MPDECDTNITERRDGGEGGKKKKEKKKKEKSLTGELPAEAESKPTDSYITVLICFHPGKTPHHRDSRTTGQKFARLSSERGTLQLRFSMSVLRAPVITALALLIVSGGSGGRSGSASARSTTTTSSLLQLLTASRREAAEHHAHSTEHHAHSPLPIKTDYSIESREGNEVNKSNQHDQTLDVFPRDVRQKEKFLKHLTGPLYFSPKCSKHFYRLYHNTRDCTIPAYYRRCARLLRRLAESQRCSEG
ncbi:hypothetical protein PGIGA_G00018570 [Pangasianodon gigas]|uniref:Uncharacterized protein n=1 Tax=Pangasianodon gigas TaxID=30993 RepID=A0ACC5WWV9_PANGG|nr:hypothetical protein [Pangasianodon gigas]